MLAINKKIVFVVLFAFVIRLVFSFLFSLPLSGDEMWHFLAAKNFASGLGFSSPYVDNYWGEVRVPFPATYRPPLFVVIAGAVMDFFGNSFYVMQIVNVVAGTIAVWILYLISKKMYGEPTAILAGLFAAINPIFISLSIGGESRMFFAVIFLLSVYFWICKKKDISGIFCGIAILTHQMGFALAVGFGIMMLLEKDGAFLNIRRFLLFFSSSLLALIILFLFNFTSSASVYVPFITEWEQMEKLEPPNLFEFDFKSAVSNTVQNIVRSVLPLPLSRGEDGLVRLNFDFINNPNLNYNSLSSVTTIVLLVLALLWIRARWKKKLEEGEKLFCCLSAGGLIVATLAAHFPAAYTYSFLFGVSFLIIILGTRRILEEDKRRRIILIMIVLICLLLQFVVFLGRPTEKPGIVAWIEKNVGMEERIMSKDCLEISFYTGRTCFITPHENNQKVMETAKKYGIKYMVQKAEENKLLKEQDRVVFGDSRWYIFRID
ncbi:MAG: glycosyltransferase family 39 protein [Candidatus Anstonellales archaeon]